MREFWISNNKLVQVIPQEVRTCVAPVAVKNSKELNFGPPLTLLVRWFLNIENNGNAVFIVLSDDALVRIRPVRLDYPVFFDRTLCIFKVWKVNHWNHIGQSSRASFLLQNWQSLRGSNVLSWSMVEFICVGRRSGAKGLLYAIPNSLRQLIALTALDHLQILIWSRLIGWRHSF
jgi:hypothetical protein